MQKLKLLATNCGAAAGSPTQSPTTSPVVHLRRRRKTLRMLLARGAERRLPPSPDRCGGGGNSPEKPLKELTAVRHKLKDLFVSSPAAEGVREGLLPSGGGGRRGGRSTRPMSAALRRRLLRRAWRPMLVAIPE